MGWLRAGGAGFGALRVVIGVVALVRPALVARPWVGGVEAERPAAAVLGRATGGRDIAIGVGTMLAARRADLASLLHWAIAGTFCDAVDASATAVSWRRLPPGGRALVAAAALGGVAGGVVLSRAVGAAKRG